MQTLTAARPGSDNDRTVVNRERAERRRAVARTVRDLRERLSSTSGTRRAFDLELMVNYAQTRIETAFALPCLILVAAACALLWLPPAFVLAWTTASLAIHGGIVLVCRRFAGLSSDAVRLKLWTRRFALAELLSGFAWAALIVRAAQSNAAGVEIFQFAVMLTVVAVSSMLAASLRLAAVAASAPVALALAAVFALHHELLYSVLALLALGAEAFFLMLAKRLYASTLAVLEYRAEKDHLVAELGTANAVSDESRRRAEEANLAKSRFLATMSHELRTPLNAILGFSEVMKNEVLGPLPNKNYREYSADIHASGQHLLNLINEILDLSRIEAGRYELNEESVTLVAIVEDCENLVRLKARNKNLTIVKQFEPNLPKLWADERAVRQVVLNLLSNAVKFTPPGGEIRLLVGWTAGGGQYVSVRDNGPGIPEDEMPIVLSSFGQGSIAIKSAEQGTGLGLPIVQALMDMHDGTFELKSKVREGTEAIACFPRSRVMEPLAPIVDGTEHPPARWQQTA